MKREGEKEEDEEEEEGGGGEEEEEGEEEEIAAAMDEWKEGTKERILPLSTPPSLFPSCAFIHALCPSTHHHHHHHHTPSPSAHSWASSVRQGTRTRQ